MDPGTGLVSFFFLSLSSLPPSSGPQFGMALDWEGTDGWDRAGQVEPSVEVNK